MTLHVQTSDFYINAYNQNLHHEGVIKMKNNGNFTIEQCLRHNILKFERKFMDY